MKPFANRVTMRAARNMRGCITTVGVIILGLIGCDEKNNLAGPDPRATATIQDGNNSAGNQHFYWLRPMVEPPASFTGTFDPTQAPEIRICALTVDLSGCDGADIASFGESSGAGSEIVRMEPGEEQYVVNWHANRYDLDPAKHYRIRAYIGGTLLGLADVDVVDSGKGLRNVNTDEYIALVENRTLPIKFRVEEGAVPQGQLNGEPSLISAGAFHSCGLAVDGQAYCWGHNYYGELGNGTSEYGTNGTNHSATPVKVLIPSGVEFREIVAGEFTTCALTTTGSVYCWGYGAAGGLGNGTFTYIQPTPVAVAGGHVFATLVGAGYHSCGLKVDQSVWCWGYNSRGQLGDGLPFNNQSIPRPVAGGLAFRSVSAGGYHTCGLRTDGAAYCWGSGGNGELGILNELVYLQPSPAPVLGGHIFVSIDAGGAHTCALKAEGGAWCWGSNTAGAGGTGSAFNFTPTAVSPGRSFTAITAGSLHTCALVASGAAYCWGDNVFGQVGNGSFLTAGPSVPTPVTGNFSFTVLDAGSHHTCGVTSVGAAKCWGYDGLGAIGDGAASFAEAAPTAVIGGLTFRIP